MAFCSILNQINVYENILVYYAYVYATQRTVSEILKINNKNIIQRGEVLKLNRK